MLPLELTRHSDEAPSDLVEHTFHHVAALSGRLDHPIPADVLYEFFAEEYAYETVDWPGAVAFGHFTGLGRRPK